MRYNRGNLSETLVVAKQSAQRNGDLRYVYARAGGFAIERHRDPFHQRGYRVWPAGNIEHIGWQHATTEL